MRSSTCLIVAFALGAAPLLANDPYLVTTPGKAGTGGLVPALDGAGGATPGSTNNAFVLVDALPDTTATLVVSLTRIAAPFKGGILGPVPDFLFLGLPTGASGGFSLPFSLPGITPAGFQIFTQAWIADPGASFGLSASNSLVMTVQDPVPAGSLFPGPQFGTGNLPFSVAIGDLNEDGLPDLAVANFSSDNVSVLLGQGDGTFASAQNFGAGDGTRSVAIGDLNQDGLLDLAVANWGAANVSVLLNQL
jgi:hypothetical protein